MTGLTIVAIPSQDDYVWRLSSEKVPHLTILNLGESDSPGRIFDFLKFTTDLMMHRFGLSVDYRGTLGDKEADVLFFEDDYCDDLENLRDYLLNQVDIRRAYDATEQYDEWTPHLTMGYPATPAKKDTRDYPGTNWVNFDRIALWTGDYAGPEIRLDENNRWGESYMSEPIDEFLEHFGVRGMKWGVRRSEKQLARAHGSEDHNTATAARAKAKKGGVKALSNAELKTLVERMNLEQQYSKVVPPSKGARVAKAGGKFAGDILIGVGKSQATRIANDHAAKLIATAFKK